MSTLRRTEVGEAMIGLRGRYVLAIKESGAFLERCGTASDRHIYLEITPASSTAQVRVLWAPLPQP